MTSGTRTNQRLFQACRPMPLLLLVALLLLVGCGKGKNTYAPPPPPKVTVAEPVQKAVTVYAEFPGTTQAVESVDIRARVEGYLQDISFTPSSEVQKGDPLFLIDPRPYQAVLHETEAELLIRQAELKVAEATFKRKESAYRDRAVSEVEVIEARAQRDKALAAIEAAKAAIETARLNLSYTKIQAPISGRIGRNLVDVGNLVGAGGDKTLLATIVNDTPIYAYFNVSEREILAARQKKQNEVPGPEREKHPVFLGLANEQGFPHEGYLDYIDNRVDPETGTIQVRGVFANKDRAILPGLFARLRLPTAELPNALLVNDRALGTDQRGRYLLVVNSEDIVEYRPVETGALVNGLRVITKGISAKDRVIVNGILRARPGIKVTPENERSPSAAKAATPKSSE